MENWIEKIKEFIRKAMNEGLKIKKLKLANYFEFSIIKEESNITFIFCDNYIHINTPKGETKFPLDLTKRDILELDTIVLSIEEYNEDMAMMEFNNFFGDEDNKPTTIDNLDDDD